MPYKDRQRHLDYFKEWRAARRNKAIDLLGGQCVRCLSTDNLELDHIDPATKDPRLRIGTYLWSSWSWEAILIELGKCQLLCYTCHKAKTKSEALKPHGHVASYKRGCRCRPCTDANTEKFRAYRKSKREQS